MSTTDTRPGFRLPWTTDHRAATAEAATDADALEAGAEATTPGDLSVGAQSEATVPVSNDSPEDPVTSALTTSSDPATLPADAPDAMSPEYSGPASGVPPAPVASPAPVTAWPRPRAAATSASTPRSRPTKFLADLTKAMQVAAEAERAQTLARFQTEAAAFIEQVRGDATERATSSKKQADDDIAGIRDWSKAEMARVREETEARISGRKGELEAELARHADQIERAVQGIEGRVDAYAAEMAAFFERLLALDDPTEFAATAASLPEPPSLTAEDGTEGPVTVESEGLAGADAEASDAAASPSPADESLVAAAGSTAAVEDVARPEAMAGAVESTAPETSGPMGIDPESLAGDAPAIAATAAWPFDDPSRAFVPEPIDPRLAALGLTPDYAAAEAEAEVAADRTLSGDGSDDARGIAALDDGTLAARVAALVPNPPAPRASDAEPAPSPSGESITTRVIVVGLISVASIAGFKRHLAHAPGIGSVSVSSGPDGEFIFTTSHAAEVSLQATVSALPGFEARVTDVLDGALHVAAHDPEAEG